MEKIRTPTSNPPLLSITNALGIFYESAINMKFHRVKYFNTHLVILEIRSPKPRRDALGIFLDSMPYPRKEGQDIADQ